MDIIKVVQISVLNVTLPVKPVTIFIIIANPVIQLISGQSLTLLAFVSTVTLKTNNLSVKCVPLHVLHVLNILIFAIHVYLKIIGPTY